MKKHTQNVLQKLVQDSFLKEKQNWADLCINNLNIYTVCFYCTSELRTTKLFGNGKLWVSKTIDLLLSCMCESYSEHICLGSSHFWLTVLVFTSHWRRGKSKLTKTHNNRAGLTEITQLVVTSSITINRSPDCGLKSKILNLANSMIAKAIKMVIAL